MAAAASRSGSEWAAHGCVDWTGYLAYPFRKSCCKKECTCSWRKISGSRSRWRENFPSCFGKRLSRFLHLRCESRPQPAAHVFPTWSDGERDVEVLRKACNGTLFYVRNKPVKDLLREVFIGK